MTSPTTPKTLCSTCTKTAGIFTCRGCQKDFCMRHANEHRQELGKQIDELAFVHDQFRQNISEQMEENANHPLMKQIDEWEQQSINKIHQTANEMKNQVKIFISQHLKNVSIALTNITNDLNQAREKEDYFETDLNEWMEKLNQLKEDLFKPELINIEQNDNIIPFISKPSVIVFSDDSIERTTENIRIEDNGQVIVHNHHVHSHAAARGKGEYSWGQHRFRFKIEVLNANKWIFFGIVSKNAPLKDTSHSSLSSYGWAAPNQVYINGSLQGGYKGYKSDMEMNDTMELIVDCDQHKIHLKNQRTQAQWELNIDLKKCPFPWQIHFNLHYADDRIRILST